MNPPHDLSNLPEPLQRDGFTFVTGEVMHGLLGPDSLTDWADFSASWNDLAADEYLAARGRYRRRRYAVYSANASGITRLPHQPHYQSLTYNALQGDIQRWFEPVLPAIGDGASMHRLLGFAQQLFSTMAPHTPSWHVEVHQFRIEARVGEAGEPTPEGVHRDGVDYVMVLLIERTNIESGTTTIHTHDGDLLGSFTLTHTFDAALLDDARVRHGVTAVTPVDPAAEAHRDVLVVTFRAN